MLSRIDHRESLLNGGKVLEARGDKFRAATRASTDDGATLTRGSRVARARPFSQVVSTSSIAAGVWRRWAVVGPAELYIPCRERGARHNVV